MIELLAHISKPLVHVVGQVLQVINLLQKEAAEALPGLSFSGGVSNMLGLLKQQVIIKHLDIICYLGIFINKLACVVKEVILHAQYKDVVFLHVLALIHVIYC